VSPITTSIEHRYRDPRKNQNRSCHYVGFREPTEPRDVSVRIGQSRRAQTTQFIKRGCGGRANRLGTRHSNLIVRTRYKRADPQRKELSEQPKSNRQSDRTFRITGRKVGLNL
jgi:hypothetical protein